MEVPMLGYLISKEQFLGLVRHAITFIGGIIVAKGNLDPSALDTIVGVAVSVAGLIWSLMSEEKTLTPSRIVATLEPNKMAAIDKILSKTEGDTKKPAVM
jgi:hypothetical protein